MSYCRWSPECDVYVYEDVAGGFTCHVGSMRVINIADAPKSPSFSDYSSPVSEEDMQDFLVKYRAYTEWLKDKAIREPIGLEFDGKSFNTETATGMGNELSLLKFQGYLVPDYAIEALFEEGKENGEQAEGIFE